jgi:hypothetical protein
MRISAPAPFALTVALAGTALAESPLTPTEVTVTRHDTFINYDTDTGIVCCAHQVYLSGADADFIYIDADFDVAWSEDLDSVSYNSREILLAYDGAEEPIQSWGRVAYMPVVEASGASVRARRPRDFPDETVPAFLNAVFTVPNGIATATLLVGPEEARISVPITIPAGTTEMPPVTDYLTFTPDALQIVDVIETSERRGPGELAGQITAGTGQILALDLTVQALVNADMDADPGDNQVFYYNTAIALVGPDGAPLAPMGQDTGGAIRNDYSNSISWDTESSPNTRRMYYLGSGTPGTYRVFYLTEEVGQIDLAP